VTDQWSLLQLIEHFLYARLGDVFTNVYLDLSRGDGSVCFTDGGIGFRAIEPLAPSHKVRRWDCCKLPGWGPAPLPEIASGGGDVPSVVLSGFG
jgi:hypothetical protein